MAPLVLSDGYAFNNPKVCGKLMGSKSRSSFMSKVIRKKSATKSKSTAVSVLNAYLSRKNKIMVTDPETSAPEPPQVAAEDNRRSRRVNEEILRWTNGIYVNGQFFLVSMGMMLNSGWYLPVIDKNGSFLGDFGKLDDLSLCDWEA